MKQTLNYVAGLKEGVKVFKKTTLLLTMVLTVFLFVGCVNDKENKEGVSIELKDVGRNESENGENNIEWTNDNAVYAYVKADYASEIINDVEGSFVALTFKDVYVAEKNASDYRSLVLLFVLEEGEEENQQAFINLLESDERINSARVCRDLPFPTIDERYIEAEKDTIKVGETLTLEFKNGYYKYYTKPFEFTGFLVKPVEKKDYTTEDFKEVNLKGVEERENDWLYLELETEDYYELIKTMDVVSKLTNVEKVTFDVRTGTIIPPVWETINGSSSIVKFVSRINGSIVTIEGVNPGTIKVGYNGVWREVTVIE